MVVKARPPTRAPSRLLARLSQFGVLIALIALIAFGGVRYHEINFLSSSNIVAFLFGNAPYALVAMGMAFVIMTGGIDLSVGSVVSLAGVVAALLSPYGVLAAVLGALATGALVGLINALIITRLNLQPFIATLATLSGTAGLALLLSQRRGVTMSPAMTELGQGKGLAITLMLLAFLIGAFALTYTRFGRHTLAVGGNEDASKLMGLNVRLVLTQVYMLSGGLAGLAGVMLASQNGAGDPNAGIGWELGAITSVVVGGTLLTGGVGSIWATLAGATLIGLIRNMLNFENGLGVLTLSSYWQSVITGALLLLVVVLQSRLARREQDQGA